MDTDQGSTESRLSRFVAQFDALIEGAPLGIGIFDQALRHVRINPALEEMNGRPAATMLGRTPGEVNGKVGWEAEVLYRQVLETGVPMRDVRMTGEVGARPGDVRHWSVTFHPIRELGDVVGLCVIVNDTTVETRLIEALAASERRHRTLAGDLQRSLLPPEHPEIPGGRLAAVYRPAVRGSGVGGDFYDVIRVEDGRRWMLVVGDVQGKGPLAASLSAAVRYAIRTAVVVDPDPVRVLQTVNRVLLQLEGEDRLCTAVCVLVDEHEDHWAVRSVAAGHPLPLVLRGADGAVEPLGGHGSLLGVVPTLLTVEGYDDGPGR